MKKFVLSSAILTVLVITLVSICYSGDTGQKILDAAREYEGKIIYSQEERHTLDETGDLIKSDCSDFARFIIQKVTGIEIGDWTGSQVKDPKLEIIGEVGQDGVVPIGERMNQLQIGDLIYRVDYEEKSNHVAIYGGKNKVIDCSTDISHDPSVHYRDIPEHWYKEFKYIRRIKGEE